MVVLTSRVLRGAAALAAVLVGALVSVLVVAPARAQAHTELLGTSPAQDASVTAPIAEVTLTFSGPVQADTSTVAVLGPGERDFGDGPVRVVDSVVHQAVDSLRSGSYHVRWRVVAADGHPMTGEFTFVVALPPELEPTTATTAPPTTATAATPATAATTTTDRSAGGTGDGGSSWWWLAAVAPVAALVAVLLLLRRRREN